MQPPNSIKIIRQFPDPQGFFYTEQDWYQQHGNANVIMNCNSSKIFYDRHWTPLSVKCVRSGQEVYQLNRINHTVNQDNFLILNEGCMYSSFIQTQAETESFTLHFTQQNINIILSSVLRSDLENLDDPHEKLGGEVQFIERLYPYSNRMGSYISKLQASLSETSTTVLFELLYLLLGELLYVQKITDCEIEKITATKRSTREELYKRLYTARDYMYSCYNEEVSLQQLSQICLLNGYYLLKEFKKYFQLTPHQYLTKRRLEVAKQLLLESNEPIEQIVHEIGFKDTSSFYKLFKTHFNVSLSDYRKSVC